MNNIFRNFICVLLTFSFGHLCVATVTAQTTSITTICRDTGVAFAFLNGVNTTARDADRAKEEFKRLHGYTTSRGDQIRYELLYNYSNGFEDFVETFEQRLLEQEGLLEGRFELFFEALKSNGIWWSRIVDSVASASDILQSFAEWYQAAVIRNLTAPFSNPPTTVNYAEHRSRIDNWVLEGKKILFVAHSQGNLFANAAYNYALTGC